ncbi:MAG: glycosyltransferase [Terriglobia bacterium]|nr:glycosyltransferase [Terriglobia bacterium]
MKERHLRVAFFPDAFHEVDGVAVVARNFAAYARQRDIPFMMVHAGPCDEVIREGSVTRVQLRRGPIKFPLDRNHEFDLFFLRHYRKVAALLREFAADVVQITGPSDVGILGALHAYNLKIPLAAFWQTNLPEYAGLRASKALSFLPENLANPVSRAARKFSRLATMRFYRIPRFLFAPNPEIVEELIQATGKPCFPMGHGVDTARFDPRFRDGQNGPFTIGYVGRLTPEKNIRWLSRLELALHHKGYRDFRLLIVGQGAEEGWLRAKLQRAEFSGVLTGNDLSRAYANMDVLAFPSDTETFGLVVLEALASGVAPVVTATGGPKYTVQHGKTGYVARNFEEFAACVATLMTTPDLLASMRTAARQYAQASSWDSAFQNIYQTYCSQLSVPMAAAIMHDNYRSLNDSARAHTVV